MVISSSEGARKQSTIEELYLDSYSIVGENLHGNALVVSLLASSKSVMWLITSYDGTKAIPNDACYKIFRSWGEKS